MADVAPASAERPRPTVIVIGAGMAGLVAARLLHDGGCKVIVVEARQRLGGRIWTDNTLGGPCDLGASWVHGADNNPITNWCRALGIELAVTSEETRFFFMQGKEQEEWEIEKRAWRSRLAMNRAITRLTARAQREVQAGRIPRLSLATAVEPLLTGRRLRPLDRRVLAWQLSVAEGVQGAPADQLDIREWFPKETAMVNALPIGGYTQLINDAAQSLEIRLDEAVRTVRYQEQVEVLTTTGCYSADAVVITIPVGMLARGAIIFDPPLPSAKAGAISRIGYGGDASLNKILLRFPYTFWPETSNRFLSLLDDQSKRGLFSSWISLEALVGAPVLMSFMSGYNGAHFDRHEMDATIVAQALAVLQRMFGRTVPDPVAYTITRWLSDPWAQGSYSYPAVGNTPTDRLLYAEPVAQKLYFAGEATDLTHYGTVHAALKSGAAAAQRLYEDHREPAGWVVQAPWLRT
ncbi:MAG: FAD-dependent oxidoreductase [Caldilineaceae bacterium]